MDNHKYENKSDSRMMWGMMALCLLPLALLFFSVKLEPPYSWIIFILAVIFMFGHHLNSFSQKGHNYSNSEDFKKNDNKQSAVSGVQNPDHQAHDNHKEHGGCCG